MDSSVRLEPMLPKHGPAVLAIYGEGIAGGNATFESAPPTWDALDAALLPEHRFVAVLGGEVVGWVGVSPTSRRAVYAGVLEHSVYVADAAQGRGVGSLLLGGVIASAEAAGAWLLQAAIFPENTASLRLHERHGFRRVGTRSRIGRATVGPWAGTWRDTVLLERRSERVGL